MTLAKQALVAVLAATWFVGLWHQVSLTQAMIYVAISAAMVALVFGFNNRREPKLAPRRTDRRR